jgi:hypothetical protein
MVGAGLTPGGSQRAIAALFQLQLNKLLSTVGRVSTDEEVAKSNPTTQRCRRARLVIAKLDRLIRNVAFISALIQRKVHFLCCDNPGCPSPQTGSSNGSETLLSP